MLVARWGATYKDPMSVDGGLKYFLANRERILIGFDFTCPVTGLPMFVEKMEEVPTAVLLAVPRYSDATELGERRWIIEQWRSSEFMARSGRYTEGTVRDNGASTDFVFCKGCDAELSIDKDPGKPCPDCGSFRTYIKTEREDGHGKLLHTNPTEGVYDFFCRLENQLNEPLDADEHALKLIEQLWRYQQQTSRRDKLKDMVSETEKQAVTNMQATSPVNPFISPTVAGW